MDAQVEEITQYLESQMLRAARTLADQNEFAKSADVYRELAKAFPNRAETHREMAVVLLRFAQSTWIPWAKNSLASEALLAAGRANELETPHGDSLYVIPVAMLLLGYDQDIKAIIETLERAFMFFERQLAHGETVSRLYLNTASRLASYYEKQGQISAAVSLYQAIAGAATLEATGKLAPGSTKPEQITAALASIKRLKAAAAR